MKLVRIAFVAAAFLIAAVALAPLRFIIEAADMRVRDVEIGAVSGTIWSGELQDVRWRGAPLGDLQVGASLAGLMQGRLQMDLESTDGAVREGSWIVGADGGRFERLKGTFMLNRLVPGAPAGAFVSFLGGGGRLEGGRCADAHGRILVDGLEAAGLQALEGSVRCEAGRIALALIPATGGGGLDLLLDPATGALTGRTGDARMQAGLRALGVAVEAAPADARR
jgi:hypothetical protein